MSHNHLELMMCRSFFCFLLQTLWILFIYLFILFLFYFDGFVYSSSNPLNGIPYSLFNYWSHYY
jgi:hypothetical protein